MKRATLLVLFLLTAELGTGCQGLIGEAGDGSSPPCHGTCVGASGLMRLTRAEYVHSVAAVFGPEAAVGATTLPFDAAAGPFKANDAPLTETDVTDYHHAAWAIAAELAPMLASECAATDCVDHLLSTYGEALFRRPITDTDRSAYRALFDWSLSADSLEASVELVVSTMLQSPDFLYRVEHANDGPAPTQLRSIEVANRLALLLWQEGPDAALRAAAAAGELDTAEGVRQHARRMLMDPRAERAVATFHSEWLGIDELADTDTALADAMRRETEQFAIDVFRNHEASMVALFTSPETSVDPLLAEHYGVTAGDRIVVPGHVGILTHASVLSRYATASYTRPVRRGDMLLGRVLCYEVGTPPADALDQAEAASSALPSELSDRERLTAVTGEMPCRRCHAVINPAGYVFEGFDELGRHRTADLYGNPLDTSGELASLGDVDGTFDGPEELMPRLAASAMTRDCLGEQWLAFALRRVVAPEDDAALEVARRALSDTGDLREVLVAITSTDAFRYRQPRTPDD